MSWAVASYDSFQCSVQRAALSAEIILLSAASQHVSRPSNSFCPHPCSCSTTWTFPVALCISSSSSDLAHRQSSAASSFPSLSVQSCIQQHQQKIPAKRMLMHVGWPTHSLPTPAPAPSSLLFIPFLFPFPFRSRVEFTLRILNYCVHIKIGQTLIIYLFKWSWAKLLQTDDSPPFQSLYFPV